MTPFLKLKFEEMNEKKSQMKRLKIIKYQIFRRKKREISSNIRWIKKLHNIKKKIQILNIF